jgi:hypothetical protein
MEMSFPEGMVASFLDNQTVTISTVTSDTFTAAFINEDYTGTESGIVATETTGGANPVSGATLPIWNTVVPSAANNFQGGITVDGMVQWVNRGSPIENWGIQPPTGTTATTGGVQPVIGSSNVSWQPYTFYSLPSVVIDSNGNLQQVSVAGKSGNVQPTWKTSVGQLTTDNTVTWIMIQTAAQLVWEPDTQYNITVELSLTSVAASIGGSATYTGAITNGAGNTYAGMRFIVVGFTNTVNNGVFTCSSSTNTTLVLSNANVIQETNSATAIRQGSFVIGAANGTNCLFLASSLSLPSITGAITAYLYPNSTQPGVFNQYHSSLPSPTETQAGLNSLYILGYPVVPPFGGELQWATINSAGIVTAWTHYFSGYEFEYDLAIVGNINVPVAGTYTFTVTHQDGMIWAMGSGGGGVPTIISATSNNGANPPQTQTAYSGLTPIIGGTNQPVSGSGGTFGGFPPSGTGWTGGNQWNDTFVLSFPAAGIYPFEFDYSYYTLPGQVFEVKVNGYDIVNVTGGSLLTGTSGTTTPIWPSWGTASAPNYPSVTEQGGQITWENLGPATDFVWQPSIGFTLPGTTIIDPNGNIEAPYRTGVTGETAPKFATGVNSLTLDNPNLIWINEGTAGAAPKGTVSTYNGGWKYCIALVNTLDNTVSNATNPTTATGNFVGVEGITLAPAAGLPTLAQIDPQSDYVAIFRTTDGGDTPLLIPGQVTTWTIPLSTYITDGYVDKTPDTGLNNLIQAPILGQNTPPDAGAQNLAYHLSRNWYSIGNVVYYTTGPSTPAGNGLNGTSPANVIPFPSFVKRIVPTALGAIIFTVSDIWIVQGSATANDPIRNPQIFAQGVGLLSYNALDVNGAHIGFFTSDHQFCILNPNGGIDYAGFPIGDQFRLDNGNPGQTWNPANVHVSWYVNGEDQGWFVSDGTFGWYKLITTPVPEQGMTWSPFATIVGGCSAVQAVETSPGVHSLLVGPSGTGYLLQRDLTTNADNGSPYPAYAIVGSAVLAQPGQVAIISFVHCDSIKTGTPMTLGIILDEAIPYYTGAFNILKRWENDPPNLKSSKSLYSQRFYLSELTGEDEEAACRHCQIKVQWAEENAANELITLTIFGGFMQEK